MYRPANSAVLLPSLQSLMGPARDVLLSGRDVLLSGRVVSEKGAGAPRFDRVAHDAPVV